MIKMYYLLIFMLFLCNCFNKNNTYDYNIIIKINENDINILKERLKLLRINNFQITKLNNDIKIKFNNEALLKNKINTKNFNNILLTNHYYEVYYINRNFVDELEKFILSDYNYKINFNSILDQPILTGVDIDKVKISLSTKDKDRITTVVKYSYLGKIKNEEAIKANKDKMEIIFLDKQFWSYSRNINDNNFSVSLIPNKYIIKRFKKTGKDYTDIDIMLITLLSKHNFNYPVEIIEINEIKTNK